MDNLNPQQRLAVETLNGNVLVLAGAGTGKTRVLVMRMILLLEKGLAKSKEILAVTFTNKAANEMKERIHAHGADVAWLGTFHSLSSKILRVHAEKIGFSSSFSIVDSEDQLRLIKQILKADRISEKDFPPKMIAHYIRKWKDQGFLPEQLTPRVPEKKIAKIYSHYQERLNTLGAMDFGDLLLQCLRLFDLYPPILEFYQRQFRYILVDEYQDTNIAQHLWLRLLSKGHQNLCCVGDDDQSIYGWRGAEVGNILKFEQDFKDAIIIRLEQNYRSTGHILAAASGMISQNVQRLGKDLWTDEVLGEKIIIRGTKNCGEEARFVSSEIERLKKTFNLFDMAILVRAGFQTRTFEERLLTIGLAYRVIGGLRFYERQEIKDALAYAKLLIVPSDDMAFERIVNIPKRGVGQKTLQTLHKMAREQEISLPKAGEFYAYLKENSDLKLFFRNLERWRSLLNQEPHERLMEVVLEESGYTDFWRQDKSLEAQGRLENLKELIKAIEEFGNLQTLLEHVHLISENTNDGIDAISLMTLHSAKGLEFKIVFLPGWEEGLFPNSKALQEKGLSGLEEERRLAYVGLSRAREKAYITYALQRRQGYGRYSPCIASRFISDIPKDHIIHNEYVPPSIEDEFLEGERVFHQQFGPGTVQKCEVNKAVVDFDHLGERSVFCEFLKKEKARHKET